MKEALLIFAKNAEAGKVKTRLAATMGDETALAIYNQLLLHTASQTQALRVDKFLFYSNYIDDGDVWNRNCYHKEVQQGNDLGERMKNAFTFLFPKGYDKAVIIGTDCPGLSEEIISNAFDHLNSHDVVIGPAEDGGYYLLGMTQPYTTLFENIRWSTDTVLEKTIGKCESLHLSYQLLPLLNDIDEEKDLESFKLLKP